MIGAAIDEDAEHFLHQWQSTNHIVTTSNIAAEGPLPIDVSPGAQEQIEEARDRGISDETKHVATSEVLKRD